MKPILLLFLSAFTASAATLYPVMSDNTNRTITGGTTNLALLNGTNVFTGTNTFSSPIMASVGSVSSPSVSFGSANTGIYDRAGAGGERITFSLSGIGQTEMSGANLYFASDTLLGWSSGTIGTGIDTAFTRTSAGVILLNRGLVTTNITSDGYRTTQQTLGYTTGTNLVTDASKSLHFVSLTNTAYLTAPTNLVTGASFTIHLQQDATGTRAVTFDTNYWKFPGGVVPTITTNALGFDVLSCISCPYGTNVFAIVNQNFR